MILAAAAAAAAAAALGLHWRYRLLPAPLCSSNRRGRDREWPSLVSAPNRAIFFVTLRRVIERSVWWCEIVVLWKFGVRNWIIPKGKHQM
jgi:hypothetical protein